MRNFFAPPDISSDFESFQHGGGLFIGEASQLITLQEELIIAGLGPLEARRQELINLQDEAATDIQHQLQLVLRETSNKVQAEAQAVSRKVVEIDPALSAVWIEDSTDPSNLIVHRDAANPEIVRATFSVSPTRLLPVDVSIPINDEAFRHHRYPLGSDLLPGMENMTTSSAPGNISLMGGATYHCAPNPDQVIQDFVDLYGNTKHLKSGKIPRIFGSIWGRIT